MLRILPAIMSMTLLSNVILAAELEVVTNVAGGIHGLAFHPDGTLYYSDSFANQTPTPRAYTIQPPYDGPTSPTGITGSIVAGLLWDQDQLYVCFTGLNTVRRYDQNLTLQQSWSISAPWNIARVGTRTLGRSSKRWLMRGRLPTLRSKAEARNTVWLKQSRCNKLPSSRFLTFWGTEIGTGQPQPGGLETSWYHEHAALEYPTS